MTEVNRFIANILLDTGINTWTWKDSKSLLQKSTANNNLKHQGRFRVVCAQDINPVNILICT